MTLAPSSPNIASTQAPGDMLDALLGVFSAKGYEGASLTELARACERSKASLYHHFPGGKQQMIEVLVTRCVTDLDQLAFQTLRHSLRIPLKTPGAKKSKIKATAHEAVETFVDGFSEYLQKHDGHCLLATLALTQPGLLTPLPQTHLGNWLDVLATAFERMGHKPKAAKRAAHALLARLYGSLTLVAMGSGYSMQQACKLLKKDLRLKVPQKRT